MTCNSCPRIVVVGVGNPILSDDSIGIRIANEIAQCINGIDVKIMSLAGLDILDVILDYNAAIIIDAIITGDRVGQVRRFAVDDLPKAGNVSSHDTGLIEAIAAGRLLMKRRMPPTILLYTVEVKEVSTFSEELSPNVKASILLVIDLVEHEIERLRVQ